MKIQGSVVFVTGGGRGLGKALVDEVLARGAAKVYATARDPKTITNPDVVPLQLEVTDPASVAAAVAQAPDVNLLINNAGVTLAADYLNGDLEEVRREFEINFYGPLHVTRALAPRLIANGGHLLNIHSALSWYAMLGAYAASKAALWSMSNALRQDLHPHGVGVTGLHVGWVDTDLATQWAGDAPRSAPGDVARQAIDGVEAGLHEVLADEWTRQVKGALAADITALYPHVAVNA
ncbi:NADP-dependent 3-hydroxy acid dehydrogenase YdfG [Streptosporangium subroseum]|uniref:NADP-dependent 3-hydroxy acid dehydrogenase YdfG n=1 Tax=Streptosporangium subroseum TaxID=106412 RepID=A0A239A316_9ACTN|nr:SDR family oxidoreductase [Streptosporangium subroseum]SNR89889.1 NADP-dependent 3-hydroxy acid dehydrogenase YdfG [Streptosporangium subroseum]